jgi:hypothetical protein
MIKHTLLLDLLFRVRSFVLEIFLFHSFAMINSYRRSFNINFALSFLFLSLSPFLMTGNESQLGHFTRQRTQTGHEQ